MTTIITGGILLVFVLLQRAVTMALVRSTGGHLRAARRYP